MDTLQQRIAMKFLEKLATTKQVDAIKVEQLRKLLKDNQRPKVDDFVKTFTLPAGGDIK
jgi:CO dehydrogenase/acetyl-CoA synthase beta subunit